MQRRKNMKMTKRIFIALMIVAVMVCSLAFSALAADLKVEDYENVLEYYEESTLIEYDFTGEDVDYSADLLVKNPDQVVHQFITDEDENALFAKYLSISVKEREGRPTVQDNHVYFAWSSDEAVDDFNVDMTVAGSVNSSAVTEKNLPKIVVVVGDTQLGGLDGADLAGVTIAAIDYREQCFTYLKSVTDADGNTYGIEYKTDYAISADSWYNVSVTYDVDKGISITVYDCADVRNKITVTDGYVPYESVKDIRIGAHGYDNGTARGTEIKLAGLRIQGGVYHRVTANMIPDIEEKILSMYELFNESATSYDDRDVICGVAAQLKAYGFTSEDADVQAALDELSLGTLGVYNSRIAGCVESVYTLGTYGEKRALVDETLVYVDMINEMDLTDADADLLADVAANISALNVADQYLKDVEAETLAFIVAVEAAEGIEITNYPVVKSYYVTLSVYTPDVTYEGVESAYSYYSRIATSYTNIVSKGDAFIEASKIVSNIALDINTRADAYRLIQNIYFDNTTYPGVAEAIMAYDLVRESVKREIDLADSFIMYVEKADYAVYITAKQENLELASQYMYTCNPSYNGVAEAKVLYAEIQAEVSAKVSAAEAYVSAVNALDYLSGAALTSGIEKALALQAEGNVLGVPGVTEANIKLEKIVASNELSTKYCEYFIRLVNSIDTASSTEELYSILANAKLAEANADQRYPGVAEASEKLDVAITDYNDQVAKINAAFDTANKVAANTAGVGKETAPVADHVIALIKKFFDEE